MGGNILGRNSASRMKVAESGRIIILRLTGDLGMKLKFVLLSFLLASVALAQVNPSPLRITRPIRGNLLTWTNRICANVPVYQVLRSTNIVQTNWQHFLYVTNA